MSDSTNGNDAKAVATAKPAAVEAVTDELAAALDDLKITSAPTPKRLPTTKEDQTKDDGDEKDDTTTADEDIARWLSEAPEALRHFAAWIEAGHMSQIIVVAGAGLSVAAGIPDFRTPGSGLYDNLQKYNLPYPEAVFDLDFFAKHPQPFVQLARELWPGLVFRPTLTHSFLTLLHQKGLLLRCYTQNIDGLEHLASLPPDALVECHGHFRTASCIKCGTAVQDVEAVRTTIVTDAQVPRCARCQGLVKPDIVFFGEDLPARFHRMLHPDVKAADGCLVLGTSLQVAPVSSIPNMVGRKVKRVLLNREKVGNFRPGNGRDLFHAGDCDASVEWVAKCLGWWPDLQALHGSLSADEGNPA